MYIEAVPNRASPPAILLRESYRDAGKIKKRTLANLSDWPTELVEGLRTLLKGGTAIAAGTAPIIVRRSLPHGAVAAVLGALRAIGLDRVLGGAGERCRELVIAMLVNRIVAPASKAATARMLDGERPLPAWARCSGSERSTRTSFTRRSIGSASANRPSRRAWRAST